MAQLWFDQENSKHNSFALAGSRPHYNPDRPGQVEHIFLDLNLDLENRFCSGICHIRLNPIQDGIQHLTLDAVNQKIFGVTIGNQSQAFDYDDQKLEIHLFEPTQQGKSITLSIAYSLTNPQRGLYFIQPTADYPRKPIQAWTQGEDEDSRFWFPCFDYPGQLATSEIRVQVPRPYVAISNGTLLSVAEADQHKIYHWSQQQVHPTYLMTLAVGDFAEIHDQVELPANGDNKTIPVVYYVDKSRESDARRSMGKTPSMIEFFSQTYGYNYPYPKYAQVCVDDFIFGGMENTSTTLLTDRCLLDERAALDNRSTESLVAHELAHQWFGDLVVIKHWSHAWIKEGMASYAEVLWTAQEYGQQDAAYYLLNEARNYLHEDRSRYRRPIVTHVYREAIELYDRHLYEKGACVYHMIRAELGEEQFWRAIQTFVRDNAHQTVETVDLLRAIEKATGRNLLFLFDQYVYRGGHPDYKVTYSWDSTSNLAKVTVTQTQATSGNDQDRFDLKLPIGFGYRPQVGTAISSASAIANLKIFTVRVHEAEQSFYFPLESKPEFVSFDVGNHYLKTVTLEYPLPELKAQLQLDPDPISRIYAAQALGKKGGLEALNALATALQQELFWGVRVEIAKQLAEIKLDQNLEALAPGLQDSDPRVRRTVVDAISQSKNDAAYKLLKPIAKKGDASYLVEAAAIASLGAIAGAQITSKPKPEKVLDLLETILQERVSWNEVLRSAAISGLSQMKTSSRALSIILDYTVMGIPQPLRLAAIRALGSISTGQERSDLERIHQRLELLAGESFFLTQVAVVIALGQMETTKAIALLQRLSSQTLDGRVKRLADEAIQRVQKAIGADKTIKGLQDDLEQLKKSNQELLSRLAALEAKTKSEPDAVVAPPLEL
jgi:aminopeptidase N